jgi:nicotinate-nucleotide adenylyltransferase
MMPLAKRLRVARAVAGHPRIRVSALEADLGTRFTCDTLAMLHRRCPNVRFVWLMGADNLTDIRRWRRWRQIFRQAPIAVFDRSPYSYRALAGLAAHYWWWARRPAPRAKVLADGPAPAWMYLHQRPHSASATAIRAGLRAAGASGGGRNKRKDSSHKVS